MKKMVAHVDTLWDYEDMEDWVRESPDLYRVVYVEEKDSVSRLDIEVFGEGFSSFSACKLHHKVIQVKERFWDDFELDIGCRARVLSAKVNYEKVSPETDFNKLDMVLDISEFEDYNEKFYLADWPGEKGDLVTYPELSYYKTRFEVNLCFSSGEDGPKELYNFFSVV